MKKILISILMVSVIFFAVSCKKSGEGDGYYIKLTGADFNYSPFTGGAYVGMSHIIVEYYTTTDETATIRVDWSNGTTSSTTITIPSSQKVHITGDYIQCELQCPEKFIFSGTKDITIKVTMERQGEASQTISLPYTLDSW